MYCGNDLTPKWLNKVMSWVFDKPCELHDYFYGAMIRLLGDIPLGDEISKILADIFFLVHMAVNLVIIIIKLSTGLILIIPMFLGVLFGGWSSYKRKANTIKNNMDNAASQ